VYVPENATTVFNKKNNLTQNTAIRTINSNTNVLRNPTLAPVIQYLNTNRDVLGQVTGGATVTFAADWKAAPAGLPPTDKTSFIFYINGILVNPDLIVAFTNIAGNSYLTVDTDQLGYELETSDDVIAIGKFI
jgi:hypothetical protein